MVEEPYSFPGRVLLSEKKPTQQMQPLKTYKNQKNIGKPPFSTSLLLDMYIYPPMHVHHPGGHGTGVVQIVIVFH